MEYKEFTETTTEIFYDTEDNFYRSFWDKEGSLHWGYFDSFTEEQPLNFLKACERWNDYMLEHSGITAQSQVLDVGCGNGNTAVWLAKQTGCTVIGIDLSGVRVENAKKQIEQYPSLNVSFQKASATELPFPDSTFTHVWSQATLYHVHDRPSALHEISRVLKEKGIFIFDDLVSPTANISALAQKYVYERLLFSPSFSHENYQEALNHYDLMVLKSNNLNQHLDQSYACLAEMAKPQYPELSFSYHKMREAITAGELGWSFYHCEKVSDRLSWIYETKDKQQLLSKYDAWANLYDNELNDDYRHSPINAAQTLTEICPNLSAHILDVGVGTGMVGEALSEYGYTNITGVDLSNKMLEVAKEKQVYDALYQADLEKPLTFFEPETFEVIVAVGVFTYGHAAPDALANLFQLLKLNGFFILTIRVDYYESNAALREILQRLSWKVISQKEFTIFKKEPMYTLVLQKHST